jgi:hypothetical protein
MLAFKKWIIGLLIRLEVTDKHVPHLSMATANRSYCQQFCHTLALLLADSIQYILLILEGVFHHQHYHIVVMD